MNFIQRLYTPLLLALLFIACTQTINTANTDTTSTTGNGTSTSDPKKPAYTPPSNTGDSLGGGSTSTGTGSSSTIKDTLTLTDSLLTPCTASNAVVLFTLTGTNNPKAYTCQWYFGDNNSILAGPPVVRNTYTYGTGSYTVIAKVDSGGVSVATISKTIKLTGAAGTPTVAVTPQSLNASTTNNSYAFNGTSTVTTGTTKSYVWDFGDGTGDNTNYTYVTHTFPVQTTAQSYIVTLTATSSTGCSAYKSVTVTVPAGTSVATGGFTSVSTDPCTTTETFTFTSTVTNLPSDVTYTWDFGDNNVSTGSSVTYAYKAAGTYTVKMYATSASTKTIVYTATKSIRAYGPNVGATANFTYSKADATGYVVNFQSTSTVANGTAITGSNSRWFFGDQTTATATFWQKTYSKTGVSTSYPVVLQVTSNAGCAASITQNVVIPLP